MRTSSLFITIPLALALAACNSPTGPNDGTASSSQSPSSYASIADIQQKANEGNRDAQFTLGALHQEGDGVTKDLAQARDWFEKAANQGDERAQFNLGVMYYNGEGVAQDWAKAYVWFDKAAAQGNGRATFNMGVMHYRGESIDKDLDKAKELFETAAYAGIPESQFNLAVMYAKGESVKVDPVEAFAWFTVANENGDTKAAPILENAKPKLKPAELTKAEKRAEELQKKITSAR